MRRKEQFEALWKMSGWSQKFRRVAEYFWNSAQLDLEAVESARPKFTCDTNNRNCLAHRSICLNGNPACKHRKLASAGGGL